MYYVPSTTGGGEWHWVPLETIGGFEGFEEVWRLRHVEPALREATTSELIEELRRRVAEEGQEVREQIQREAASGFGALRSSSGKR